MKVKQFNVLKTIGLMAAYLLSKTSAELSTGPSVGAQPTKAVMNDDNAANVIRVPNTLSGGPFERLVSNLEAIENAGRRKLTQSWGVIQQPIPIRPTVNTVIPAPTVTTPYSPTPAITPTSTNLKSVTRTEQEVLQDALWQIIDDELTMDLLHPNEALDPQTEYYGRILSDVHKIENKDTLNQFRNLPPGAITADSELLAPKGAELLRSLP